MMALTQLDLGEQTRSLVHEDFGTSGGTPLVSLSRFSPGAAVYAKAEHLLPSGSVFDRVAGALLDRQAEGPVVVAGCGSAALAFASAAAPRGRRLTVVVPSTTLPEHLILLQQHPLKLVRADEDLAQIEARAELEAERSGAKIVFGPDRSEGFELFQNTLGAELARQLEQLDGRPERLFVSCAYRSLYRGLSEALAPVGVRLVGTAVDRAGFQDGAVEAKDRADLSPVAVSDVQAMEGRRSLATSEGLLLGLASAASLWAAREEATRRKLPVAALVLDAGDRYFSRDEQFARQEGDD